jgi:hypothetical protein
MRKYKLRSASICRGTEAYLESSKVRLDEVKRRRGRKREKKRNPQKRVTRQLRLGQGAERRKKR